VVRGRAVVDSWLAVVAPMTAATQLGIELLEHLRRDLGQRHSRQSRLDRPPKVATVTVERGLLGLVSTQPGVERFAEGSARFRSALVVNLRNQALTDPLGLGCVCGRPGQEHPLASAGIKAGIDGDLKRLPALPDRASLSSRTGCGHEPTIPAVILAVIDQRVIAAEKHKCCSR